MWENFEARLEENERDRLIPLRRALFDALRDAGLRPGDVVTKKMASFDFGAGERLLWEVQNPSNVFLHVKWRDLVEANGFATELRPYQSGMKDGGRHSALSRDWSFRDADCIVVRIENAELLRRLIVVLTQSGDALTLNPAAVTRWIERLRHLFPAFEQFDPPDPHFDEAERTYKLEIAAGLKAAIAQAGSDQELADAVNTALAKSNLLQWRVYWPISPKGNADREKLRPALRALVDAALGAADGHASALEDFVDAWIASVPEAKPDHARQIAEFLFLHLAPHEGIYIRYSVRQDLWLEAVGSRFPDHASIADTYRDEWRFMQAVRRAFADRGLAPRDMIDVQSALWIVHNYKEEDAAFLSRKAIEAAMDAYDNYRQSGEHAAIFDAFSELHDHWVRSTRERPNGVYPSTPIVGFLRGKKHLNGGWGQKDDAAAQLHNAGYIIVGREDRPMEQPDQSSHLISGRVRVQKCAANYFIEPAKEAGASKVSIRAGDLRADLVERTPTICAALNDENLQRLAGVPKPELSGPAESRDSVFTFHIGEKAERASMTPDSLNKFSTTTNLILYGPPGTGKTYATAWEAVRLCLGDGAAEVLRNDRAALMAEYRRLAAEGRIEFITFHQSLAYEDFVEGRQPTTGSDEGEEGASAGFRLETVPGLFRRIAKRAETGLSKKAISKRITTEGRQIYKMSVGFSGDAGDRELFEEVIEGGYTLLDWEDIDWSDPKYEAAEEMLKACEAQGKIGGRVTLKSGQVSITDTFRNRLKPGDIIVVSKGNRLVRAIGEVTGPYEYHPRPEGTFGHRRSVRWLWHDPAGVPVTEIYDGNFTMRSLYWLNKDRLNIPALERYMNSAIIELDNDVEREAFVLIIDEINRANISKVFGELITLLEPDKRLGQPNALKVHLPYSRDEFGVPGNLHIIGTMNTADRSIALLDTALRRRFTFRELMPDIEELRGAFAASGFDAENLDGIDVCKLLRTINERIEYLFDREHQIGHAYFTSCRSRADIETVMRHKVIPLLAEYFYEDWSKVAAVLGDAGTSGSRFVEARQLAIPAGFAEDELGGEKLRWSVKAKFDFTEFAV
ncbi:AAA family ATPase [Rhizobium ruizarguesonis]|uniref:AAA family ATPase n=1 Tax=Rhizobium ruizarguesonis TaxID=2081791 RepID=UPI001FEFFAD3|nr:AAA family ATPase [Rhizobium ruizarguesonis]